MYKLEGPLVGQLHTGQRISITVPSPRKGASTAKSAASDGTQAGPQRVHVTGVRVLAEPAHPGYHTTVSQSAAGGSGTDHRLRQGHKQRQDQGQGQKQPQGWGQEQQQSLPTVKLPVMTASISALVLPLSFEGCRNAMGALFEAPWWTQQVRG